MKAMIQTGNNSDAIQGSINASPGGTVVLPSGIYLLGSTSLHMKSGVTLQCADPVSTQLWYEGTDAALIFDSVTSAGVSNCQIRLTGSLPALGIRFSNVTADTTWNNINNLLILSVAATTPIVGQIGVQMIGTAKHAMYWNTLQSVHVLNMDIGIQLTDAAGFSDTGPNDNTFIGITVHHCRTGMELSRNATENKIFGLSGSSSGLTENNVLLVIGDPAGSPANFNMIYGLVSDQGTTGQAWLINKGVSNTLISGTDQSGRAAIDQGSNTVIERLGGGASSLKIPQILGGASLKHLRLKVGCTTAAASAATCTGPRLLWPTPFVDSNYTVSCSLSPLTGQPHIISVQQNPFGITVTIASDRAVASTGIANCIAVHD